MFLITSYIYSFGLYSGNIHIPIGHLIRNIFLFTINIAKGVDKIHPRQMF
ncbi:hypothetical protein HMPREF1148_0976 [Selenomonas sp. FOBRC6]|nr:hypothetical protein HMPREF1148_0976 [Selenomonas sp. FOBRC6]